MLKKHVSQPPIAQKNHIEQNCLRRLWKTLSLGSSSWEAWQHDTSTNKSPHSPFADVLSDWGLSHGENMWKQLQNRTAGKRRANWRIEQVCAWRAKSNKEWRGVTDFTSQENGWRCLKMDENGWSNGKMQFEKWNGWRWIWKEIQKCWPHAIAHPQCLTALTFPMAEGPGSKQIWKLAPVASCGNTLLNH